MVPMKTKLVVFAAALLAFRAGGAAAQDPLRHELALQLLEAMHVPEQIQASLETAIAAQVRVNPEVPGLQAALREFLQRYVTWSALRDAYADQYAAAFSEEELREMTAFYRTPAGQKLARATPQLTRVGAELGARLVAAHAAELEQVLARLPSPP